MDGLTMDFPLTLNMIFRRAATIHSQREVVTRLPDRGWHRYTYADMANRAKSLAVALKKLGIQQGERVGTLCWNHHQHLEAYFGIPVSGAVLHTLNLRLHADELAHIINEAEDKAVIVDESLLPIWESVADKVNIAHIIVVAENGKDANVPDGMLNYEAIVAEANADDFDPPKIDEHQAASMCYTSGTVGKSKGVVYSHRAICLHSFGSALSSGFEIYEKDCVLPVVPMFHVNAWGLPYSAAMMGAKLVFPGPFLDAKSLLEAISQEAVTFSAGVPTVWLSVIQELDDNPTDYHVSPLRKIIVGGSALPRSLMEEFEDRYGVELVHAWGMTETAPIGTMGLLRYDEHDQTRKQQLDARGRQGTPVPGVEIRATRDGQTVPWDGETMGELEVRGPWVAKAYYKRPDAADCFSPDGWLRTGDIVSIDARGCMKIEDRAKDLIKSGGEWISSLDLENALMGHQAVAEAAVVAMPHDKWGERPLAAVVTKEGQTVTADELREYLTPLVAKWWLPDEFKFIDEIPRTSVGKFKKSTLRERFQNEN